MAKKDSNETTSKNTKREKGVRKDRVYTLADNCKPILLAPGKPNYLDLPFEVINRDNKQFKSHEQRCMFDERYKIASLNTDFMNSSDYLINYYEYVSFLANNQGVDWVPKYNKLMERYLSFGYIPIIHLPTFAINIHTPSMLAVLNAYRLNPVKIRSVPVVGSRNLSTYDYLVHRNELAKVLPMSIDNNIRYTKKKLEESKDSNEKKYYQSRLSTFEGLANSKFNPEDIRLTTAIRGLFTR